MPLVTVNAGILDAARQAIEILLQFKGTTIELIPSAAEPVQKPGGGHDYPEPDARLPQLFALVKVGVDNVPTSPNDEGIARTRNYVLTGRFDAEIDIGDTWSDAEADYRVETVDATNGYKTYATVLGYIKV